MRPDMPETAKWLLDWFGVAQNEALMGDLVEERGSGRSALWFWRQTLAAVVQTVTRDLWDHKRLALTAIATGWLLDAVWWPILNFLGDRYGASPMRPPGMLMAAFAFMVWPEIVGRVVARTDRARPAAMVLAYAFSVTIWGI